MAQSVFSVCISLLLFEYSHPNGSKSLFSLNLCTVTQCWALTKLLRLTSLSMTETGSRSFGAGDDEDQALQERMAKREERRQRRMKEALDRQRQQDPTGSEGGDGGTAEAEEERPSSWRRARYRDSEDAEEKTETHSLRREEKERKEPTEEEVEEEEPVPEGGVEAEEGEDEEEEQKEEVVEDEPRRSYAIEQVRLIFFLYLDCFLYFSDITCTCDACFSRTRPTNLKFTTRYCSAIY